MRPAGEFRSLALLAFFLLVPSMGTVQKYLGTAGALAYVGLSLAGLLALYPRIHSRFTKAGSERRAFWLALLMTRGVQAHPLTPRTALFSPLPFHAELTPLSV